jgi:hypothetical protein
MRELSAPRRRGDLILLLFGKLETLQAYDIV